MPLVTSNMPRVVLVEPDCNHARRIAQVLVKEGFALTCASSGEEALDTIEEIMPDLVVACTELPGMSGGQLARRLRLDALTRKIGRAHV